uniref:Uncharacterized protein n=1 Tax=Panagrolaimus sp. PS1159 TaxID=55785 RepID=A0AC35G2U5_9BILA
MPDIVISNFEKFPQCYQNIVNKLLADLDSTEDIETQKELLKNFAENYSMLPEFFEYYYRIEENNVLQDEIVEQSFKHFATKWAADLIPSKLPQDFVAFIWNNLNEMESELYPAFVTTTKTLKVKEKIILQFLSFPNKHLLFISKIHEEICGSVTAEIREMYLKNVELFQKLKIYYETDSTKFLEITLKIENFVSQCSNIVLLLGCHPYNKKLWEFYFKFLQDKNGKKALLNAYRRYCGIFLDDEEIKDKISKLIESINLSASVEIPTEEKELSLTLMSKKKLNDAVKNFTFENVAIQPLPFRKPLNNYIYENANANGKILIKIQMASKYFLRTLPFLVIERLEISDAPKNFHKNSLSIPAKNKLFKTIDNMYLSNSLFLVSIKASKLILKVVHCHLKYLRIRFQSLKLKEFEFFVQSGNIELLSLHEVIDENEQMVPLEVLLEKTPKVYYIHLFACQLTPQTFQNLLKLEFHTKILYFSLLDVLEQIDVESCVEFFKQNLGGNARIHIDFHDDFPEDNFVQLYTALNAMKDQWEPTDEKPEVDLFLQPMFN